MPKQWKVRPGRLTLAVYSLIFCLSAIVGVFWWADLTLNLSPSMPMGIWKKSAPPHWSKIQRGEVILFCPPDTPIFQEAKSMGILKAGTCDGSYMPLLKMVTAVPGDLVEIEDDVSVNARKVPNSRLLRFGLQGMPELRGRKVIVPEGHFWLMGVGSDRSFDSRYFGLVNSSGIRGIANKLNIFSL